MSLRISVYFLRIVPIRFRIKLRRLFILAKTREVIPKMPKSSLSFPKMRRFFRGKWCGISIYFIRDIIDNLFYYHMAIMQVACERRRISDYAGCTPSNY